MGAIADLKWPPNKPQTEYTSPHGWLSQGTRRMLQRHLVPCPGACVIELGSWLGRSTRFMLDIHDGNGVIAIDHWLGDKYTRAAAPHMTHDLLNGFLNHCWEYRNRIRYLQLDTVAGLGYCYAKRVTPDLIYVDACHDHVAVLAEVLAADRLFPKTVIVGDDWKIEGPRAAATDANRLLGRQLEHNSHAWALLPKKG